jgi:hypothetical protein
MNNYFNNLIEKSDSSTTYYVEMLANSEKLISYNYINDLSNDDSGDIFTDDNSKYHKYINKKMKSYNVDKYCISNVDYVDKPTSILHLLTFKMPIL